MFSLEQAKRITGKQTLHSRHRSPSYPVRTPFGTPSNALRPYGAEKERTGWGGGGTRKGMERETRCKKTLL